MNFYQFCYSYLLNETSGILNKRQVKDFVTKNDAGKLKSLTDVYRMLVIVLQNYHSMPRVINFQKRESEIRDVLCDFDVYKVSNNKTSFDVYNDFIKKFKLVIKTKHNSWQQFSEGVFDGAVFLAKFKNIIRFKHFIRQFQLNCYTKFALPLLLQTEIHGLGFALACNWLKELGFKDYPKPDTHTIDVFKSIGLCSGDQISCYKAMVRMADKCHVDAYALDKVIWLNCTGDYYRYNKKSKKNKKQLKKDFVKALSEYKRDYPSEFIFK